MGLNIKLRLKLVMVRISLHTCFYRYVASLNAGMPCGSLTRFA